MFFRLTPLLAPAVAFIGASCSSPTKISAPVAAPPAASTASNDPVQNLRKGLTAAEVKALLGEPQEIKPFIVKEVVGEVWVYERSFPGKTRQVVAQMRDVPYVDPITGVARMLQEPVYEYESGSIHETLELLMFSGSLVGWKQHQKTDREFN